MRRWGRRRRDRQGRERAAPKWVFHLYASEWLRGVLLRDKDWPLRPLKTNRGPGTACYNSSITAARMCSTIPLKQIGCYWHPGQAFQAQDLFPAHCTKSKWLQQQTVLTLWTWLRAAHVAWPVLKPKRCHKCKQQSEKIKQIKGRRKALFFPDDFIAIPSVQREMSRLCTAVPPTALNFLMIKGK